MTIGAVAGCNDEDAPSSLDGDIDVADDELAQDRVSDALPANFERGLSDAWACGDLLLHVANPDRSIMLTLYWPQLLDEADPTRGWEVDVGGPGERDVAIVVHTGTRLDAGTCARQGEEPAVIAQTWTAQIEAGHLELDSGETTGPRFSAWLWDMELHREGDGATAFVQRLEQVEVALAG